MAQWKNVHKTAEVQQSNSTVQYLPIMHHARFSEKIGLDSQN